MDSWSRERFTRSTHAIFLAALLLPNSGFGCALNFTSPPDGATLTTPGTTITGTGSGTANPSDFGTVTATINGAVFFQQSGTFTQLINFFGSGAASVTLEEGANQLQVDGSVEGDSCSDQMVLYYEPVLDEPQKQNGPPDECVGNPCDPATGNKYQPETDYAARPGVPTFVRNYNSNAADIDLGLGFGWSGPVLQRLATDGSVMLVRQRSGRSETFHKVSGVWQGDPDTDLTITEDAAGFTVTHPDGAVDRYDPQGLLLSMADPAGLTTTYSYENGHVVAITGPFGHILGFGYDLLGRLARLTDPAGLDTTYTYDGAGNLARVTYPDSSARQYHYEDPAHPHHLIGITDENNDRVSTYAYDASGRAILTQRADTGNGGPQEAFTLAYPSTAETRVTDAAGFAEVLTYADNLGVRNRLSRIHQSDGKGPVRTFDANNNLLSETDAEGTVTLYNYNADNQLIRRTEAAGTPQQRITEYAYLSSDVDLVTVETRPSIRAGQVVQVQTVYNAQQRPISVTESGFAPDGSAVNRATTFDYNANGQVILIDGPRSDVADTTTLAYHDCTTGNECGQLASLTNAVGHVTTFEAYDPHGRPAQMTDPNGVVTTFVYDLRGRLLERTDSPPTGQGSARLTTFDYDPAGQRILTTLPDGSTLTRTYDAAYDLVGLEDAVGNLIEYGYDRRGKRVSEDTRAPDDSLRRHQTFGYDPRNRRTTLNDGGFVTTEVFDAVGNRLSSADPNTNPTTYGYDALHRLADMTDPLDGVTGYGYDVADRVTRVTDPNGHATTYQYDDLGDRREQDSPDSGFTDADYDTAGNRIRSTDARGVTRTYQYDALNRLTAIDTPDPDQAIRYTYDQGVNGLGRLTGIVDESGTTTFEYDAFGNRIRDTRVLNGETYAIEYAYDPVDRVSRITYPSGATVDYHRDAAGRIIGVDLTRDGVTQPLASAIDYQPFGPLNALTFGNGLQQTRRHDLAYRLGQIDTPTLQTLDYTRDDNGNIAAITNPLSPTDNQSFDYDALDRLTLADGPYGHREYRYDPVGNRIEREENGQTQTYSYAADSNRLQSIAGPGATSYDYDDAGNTAVLGNRELAYNDHGRLETVFDQGTPTADYRYNAQGARSLSVTEHGTRRYLYSGDNKRLVQTHPDGAIDQELVYLGNTPLAVMSAATPAGYAPANSALAFNRSLVLFSRFTQTLWNAVALTNTGTATVTGPVHVVVTQSNATPANPAGHTNQGEPYYVLLNDGEVLASGATTPRGRRIEFLADASGPLDYQARLEQPVDAQAAQTLFVHTDHIDTPTTLTDVLQAVVWQARRSPFGTFDLLVEDVTFDLRFPGQFIDAESGLHYNFFRDYSPASGRYVQSDPIGLRGGPNGFLYANANPLAFQDFLALSAADVERMRDVFDEAVDDMNRKGERLDTSGFLGGMANNLVSETNGYSLLRDLTEKNTLICGEQWDRVLRKLNEAKSRGEFDDEWDFEDVHSIGHHSGMATSNNPDDPEIFFDPWKNLFETSD